MESCKSHKRVMLVGLCGRSGAGKGYVSALFAERGIPAIDTDQVYREMTGPTSERSPCMQELCEYFGEHIAAPDGSLDRAVMRNIVFSGDPEPLQALNCITHKHILVETKRRAAELSQKGSTIVLIDAPVLYESGFDRFCRAVVCVTAPEEKLVRRIMRRDGLSEEDARRRLASQKSTAELEERADFLLENTGDDVALIRQIDGCIERLRAMENGRSQ